MLCDMLSMKICCELKGIRLLAEGGSPIACMSCYRILSLQPVCLLLQSGAECFVSFLQAARLRQPPLQQQLLAGVQLPQQPLQVILCPPVSSSTMSFSLQLPCMPAPESGSTAASSA